MVKIIQERDKCIGCGACVAVCPDYWEMSDDGFATLKASKKNNQTGNYELEIDDGAVSCNNGAADSCPVKIIKVIQK